MTLYLRSYLLNGINEEIENDFFFFFLVVTGSVDVGTNGDNLKYICVLMQILTTGVLRVRCS
jgi:hypothetical protein